MAARLATGRRFRARRDRVAARRRRAARHCKAYAVAAAHLGHFGGRGSRQQPYATCPLSLRGGGGQRRSFSLAQGGETFTAIIAGEIVWGIGVGWTMLRLRRFMRDPRIEITLSLITPFLAYWPPEHLGNSGVIATVATGLYISWNGPRLISAATRLQGVFFWDFFLFLIEGLVFLFTGLQAQALFARIQDHSLYQLTTSAAIVSLVVIAARFVWTFPITYLPRWLIPPLARRDPSPPWQWPFIISFTGVRGIVSLAAALAIPLATADGEPFPYRNSIFFSHLLRRDGDARFPRVGIALDHPQTRPR